MDSIERMRRINDLTRELKQRGFAESSFEAIKQANQIYGQDDLEDDVKHGIIKNSPHEQISGNGANGTMGDDSVPYADRKLAKMTESMDMLTNKMNEIIRAINDLDTRFNELKLRQDKLIARQDAIPEQRIEKAKPQVQAESSAVQEKPEPKAESRVEAQSDVHEGHVHKDEYSMNQRTGNFQSQDVAIDKMFYFGKK